MVESMILKTEYAGSNLTLALICCGILVKALKLFVSEFPHLQMVIIIFLHHSIVKIK